MATVRIILGQDPPADLLAALDAAGYTVAERDADFRIMSAGEMTYEEAGAIVRFVVDGGALLLCGAGGPLPAALNLTAGAEPVEGVVHPPIDVKRATPVTGVGYALFKIGERCIAIGAPRGSGAAVYLGDNPPPPPLVVASLRWLAGVRSQSPGTK